jgi:hypothetical protein
VSNFWGPLQNQMPNYYDNWKEQRHKCRHCGWQGTGAECPLGESFRELFEIACPNCGEPVCAITYPTIKESKQNWDKLSEADRLCVTRIEENQRIFDERSLKWPSQLPDIGADSFTLIWDVEEGEHGDDTVVKLADQIIWREPEVYEGYWRFEEIAKILRKRYGRRLKDLIPCLMRPNATVFQRNSNCTFPSEIHG